MTLDSLVKTYARATAYSGRWIIDFKDKAVSHSLHYNVFFNSGICVVDIPSVFTSIYNANGSSAETSWRLPNIRITQFCSREFIAGLTGVSYLFAQWMPAVFLVPDDVLTNNIRIYHKKDDFDLSMPHGELFSLLVGSDNMVKMFRHKSKDVLITAHNSEEVFVNRANCSNA